MASSHSTGHHAHDDNPSGSRNAPLPHTPATPTHRYNLARFDLVSVRLAVACAQLGSLSAAARNAHLALAAASRRIRELEEAVGEPLFERHARGLITTAAGRVFARHGAALLQTMDRLGDELAELRLGLSRHIRLAASSAALNPYLPPLLARYQQLQPGIQVAVDEHVSEGVVAALREGRADLGLLAEGPDSSGLDLLPFRNDELVLVVPRGHPLGDVASGPIAFANLLAQDWISLEGGASLLLQQQQAAFAAGRPLKIRMQLGSFDAVCHMVAAGLGVALLPRAAVQPTLRALKLATRPLADGWALRDQQADPAIVALRNHLADPSQNAEGLARKR